MSVGSLTHAVPVLYQIESAEVFMIKQNRKLKSTVGLNNRSTISAPTPTSHGTRHHTMADEKKRLVDDESGRNTTWSNLFLLCLFLLCEVAAFVSVTLWQENSLQTFTLKIENGNRLLNELEDECARKESGYEVGC